MDVLNLVQILLQCPECGEACHATISEIYDDGQKVCPKCDTEMTIVEAILLEEEES